jgi:YD repeat-containing protein
MLKSCMKFLPLSFLLIPLFSTAQYYYNDIIGTLQSNREMQTLVSNKIRMVNATGYDGNGVKATDFAEVREIRDNGRTLKYSSRTGNNHTLFYNRFDDQNRLISIRDSSNNINSETSYQYDAAGRIIQVKNVTADPANDINQTEIHLWSYDASGKPVKMWRIINNNDSLEVRFTPDENGNPGDEKTYRRGVETGAVYYYYDDRNRVTDIVRYNTRHKKLLPDVMFEYDDKDRIIQKITTTSSLHLGYVIWRFIYNESGLKTKEALFNDDKKLTGRIEYSYIYGQ